MRQAILLMLVGIFLPLVSALVTYVFVSSSNDAFWTLDETQSLILTLALIKMVLLGSIRDVFPIDGDKILNSLTNGAWTGETEGKYRRDVYSINNIDKSKLYQVPDVSLLPCTRRFLCELETVAKTSENYLPKEPAVDYDRIEEEEEAPEQPDPLQEMHIEAVRALFRDEDPTGEINLRSRRAVDVVNGLTGGKSCEEAYRQCPGRFSTPMVFRAIFDEFNLEVHDEL